MRRRTIEQLTELGSNSNTVVLSISLEARTWMALSEKWSHEGVGTGVMAISLFACNIISADINKRE